MTTNMAKRKELYELSLSEELGRLRQLPDRVGTLIQAVRMAEDLVAAIEAGHSNLKEVAAIVKQSLKSAREVIDASS